MMDPQEPARPARGPGLPSVPGETRFAAAVFAVTMLLLGIEDRLAVSLRGQKRPPLFGLLAGLVIVFANGMGITRDRRRRGRGIGFGRFTAMFFGPAVLGLDILLECGKRALLYLPLLLAVSAASWRLPAVAVGLLCRVLA